MICSNNYGNVCCSKCGSPLFKLKGKKETKRGWYCDLVCANAKCGYKLNLKKYKGYKIKLQTPITLSKQQVVKKHVT